MVCIRVREFSDDGAQVFDSGVRAIVCGFDPVFHIRHKGRTFKFEMHSYFGPTLLNKLGRPVFPPKPKHPFWAAFAERERRRALRKKRAEKLRAAAPEPEDDEELPVAICDALTDEQYRELRSHRGGCSCHISPPCSACSNPITWGEARYLGWDCADVDAPLRPINP
jgi:hypothetical protein